MSRKPKLLYWILSTISVISFIALIIFLVYLYKFKDDSTLVGLLSAWISVSSGFLFSAIVSLIVQVINDNVYENELKNKRTQIRIRELNILTQELSFFLSFFHDNETYLKSKYKIKDSLLNGKLDINIIHENMKHLNNVHKKATKQNLDCIENYLLLSENIKSQYDKIVDLLNKKRQEFENINIDLNCEIFSIKEINSLKLIPICVNKYNDNRYTLIEDFINIVETFDLKIDFDDNKWWNILALLFSYDLDSTN